MIAGLPYDAEVEYLESTGTQWIDTGVSTKNAVFGVDCNFMPTSTESAKGFGYLTESVSGVLIYTYDEWLNVVYSDASGDGGYAQFLLQETINHWHRCTMNCLDISVRFDDFIDARYEGYNLGSYGGSYFLFANGGGSAESDYSAMKMRLSNLRIYLNNTTLVRDFIPVRVGSGVNAVGYMYDRVSKMLFGNQGTGSFVIGPDKAIPVMGLYHYADVGEDSSLGE